MNDITQFISPAFAKLRLNYNQLQADGVIVLRNQVAAELMRLRERNDDPRLSPENTARLRGHIECLKALEKCLTPNESPG